MSDAWVLARAWLILGASLLLIVAGGAYVVQASRGQRRSADRLARWVLAGSAVVGGFAVLVLYRRGA